jgi:hypothetical protein
VIEHVVHHRQPGVAQREEQRLGEAMQAEDMHHLGRKVFDRLQQDLIIMQFQRLEFEVGGHGGMAIDAIEESGGGESVRPVVRSAARGWR